MNDALKKNCPYCQESRIQLIVVNNTVRAIRCRSCGGVCQECKGLKLIAQKDEEGRFISWRCKCYYIEQKIELLNQASLPGIYFDADFDNFQKTDNLPKLASAIAKARSLSDSYAESRKKEFFGLHRGLLFHGGAGTGKTRLMSVLLRELTLKHMVPCRFVEFSELIADIKVGYDRGESENTLISPLVEIEVLGIDELGKGRRSDWWIGILDNIVARRYNAGKLTIFTTNYSADLSAPRSQRNYQASRGNPPEDDYSDQNLRERLNDRIFSRLCEMCEFVDMNFDDYRMPAFTKDKDNKVEIA